MDRRKFVKAASGLLLPAFGSLARVADAAMVIRGPLVVAAAVFQDTFTDTNGVLLENHTPTPSGGAWTRVGGVAGACDIQSNQLSITATGAANNTLYQCPSQGSANHYTQWVLRSTAGSSFVCVRATDEFNFIGARYNGSDFQLFKRVASTFTSLGSFTAAASVGDVLKLEVNGSNEIRLYVNSVLRIGPVTDSFNSTEVRQGVVPRVDAENPWIDNYEAAAL